MGELLLLIFSLVLMALFSAAETSFVSADKVALIVDMPQGFKSSAVLYFLQNNEVFFSTVVIAGNLLVTIFSSVSEILLHEQMSISLPLVMGLTTVIGFLFGELAPKSAAIETPEKAARLLLPLVRIFAVATKPVVKGTANVSSWIALKIFGASASGALMFQRRDVYRFLGSSVSSGYLDKIESDMIRRLLANAAIPVRNIAIPRTDIVAVQIGAGIEEVREIFERTKKSKVVVYNTTIDDIVGVVHAKVIFKNVERVDEIVSDILFVPENVSVVDLLEEFRTEKVYAAILIDEFGGTSGFVASSDVMELFLGDVAIWQDEESMRAIAPRQYILRGRTEVGEFEKFTGVRLPKGDFSTVAGLITATLGRIPTKGEVFSLRNAEFQVLRSDGRRIEALKVTIK